ncbi:hypothetical protein BU16DRAFT_524895 [Lophium mytilinum]|uniref:Uncharacterized protein n=1 Tax=Lophium mytilinum TaxID=390894 RepID=A0A6A6R2S5_9PEZI|nr:hypothetical protein BU16DRAFT_524895 [Lophium mytilinum]
MKARFWNGSEDPFPNAERGRPPYVTLRAPGDSASSLSPQSSKVPFGWGTWYLSHSTHERWRGKRNVRLCWVKAKQEDAQATELEWSWQAVDREEVKRLRVPADAIEDRYVVLGTGKEGSLQGWMKETEYGIADSSGEVRGDWRSQWLVLYSPAAGDDSAGVDILSTRLRVEKGTGIKYVAKPETVEQIKDALRGMDESLPKDHLSDLFEAPVDEERDKDELPKLTPKERGIWSPEDDIYETKKEDFDKTKKASRKCVVQ